MGILDWFKRSSGDRSSRKKGSSSSKKEMTDDDPSDILHELENERIRRQEQEARMKEMERNHQKMQENWVKLLKEQQSTIEEIISKKEIPKKEIPQTKEEKDDENGDQLSSPILKDKSFGNFVVDDSNRFPYLAAEAVATGSGRKYNPLFVHGPVGVGKTHLLHAIANKMMESKPDMKILYSSTERFTDELLKALEKDELDLFRERYRGLDVLLIDDIQMLSGREATQQEFFHMFNHLYNSSKQIVLCSDRPPSEIKELESRLRSRFEGGLIIDMKVPTFEGRRQILLNLSQRDGFSLSTEVLDYMAFYLDSSVRELEGGFNRITAYSSLMKEPITVTLVRKILEGFIKDKGEVRTKEISENHEENKLNEIMEQIIPDPYKELDLEEETDQIEQDLLLELKKSSSDM